MRAELRDKPGAVAEPAAVARLLHRRAFVQQAAGVGQPLPEQVVARRQAGLPAERPFQRCDAHPGVVRQIRDGQRLREVPVHRVQHRRNFRRNPVVPRAAGNAAPQQRQHPEKPTVQRPGIARRAQRAAAVDQRAAVGVVQHGAVARSGDAAQEKVKQRFVPRAGKQDPKVVVRRVGMVHAVVHFVRPGDDGVAGRDGVLVPLHHKRNIAAQVDVNFAFAVRVRSVDVPRVERVDLDFGNLERKRRNGRELPGFEAVHPAKPPLSRYVTIIAYFLRKMQ